MAEMSGPLRTVCCREQNRPALHRRCGAAMLTMTPGARTRRVTSRTYRRAAQTPRACTSSTGRWCAAARACRTAARCPRPCRPARAGGLGMPQALRRSWGRGPGPRRRRRAPLRARRSRASACARAGPAAWPGWSWSPSQVPFLVLILALPSPLRRVSPHLHMHAGDRDLSGIAAGAHHITHCQSNDHRRVQGQHLHRSGAAEPLRPQPQRGKAPAARTG